MKNKLEKGLIQIYTGPGKGKTTAAMGLALRATSRGLKVSFVQFLKSCHDEAAVTLIPGIDYHHFGLAHEQYGWLRKLAPNEKPDPEYANKLAMIKDLVRDGWKLTKELIKNGSNDIIILDELNVVIYFDLLPAQKVVEVISKKPSHLEIVITGRNAPTELLEIADLVTEMKEVKHHYQQGILAREGIDY